MYFLCIRQYVQIRSWIYTMHSMLDSSMCCLAQSFRVHHHQQPRVHTVF